MSTLVQEAKNEIDVRELDGEIQSRKKHLQGAQLELSHALDILVTQLIKQGQDVAIPIKGNYFAGIGEKSGYDYLKTIYSTRAETGLATQAKLGNNNDIFRALANYFKHTAGNYNEIISLIERSDNGVSSNYNDSCNEIRRCISNVKNQEETLLAFQQRLTENNFPHSETYKLQDSSSILGMSPSLTNIPNSPSADIISTPPTMTRSSIVTGKATTDRIYNLNDYQSTDDSSVNIPTSLSADNILTPPTMTRSSIVTGKATDRIYNLNDYQSTDDSSVNIPTSRSALDVSLAAPAPPTPTPEPEKVTDKKSKPRTIESFKNKKKNKKKKNKVANNTGKQPDPKNVESPMDVKTNETCKQTDFTQVQGSTSDQSPPNVGRPVAATSYPKTDDPTAGPFDFGTIKINYVSMDPDPKPTLNPTPNQSFASIGQPATPVASTSEPKTGDVGFISSNVQSKPGLEPTTTPVNVSTSVVTEVVPSVAENSSSPKPSTSELETIIPHSATTKDEKLQNSELLIENPGETLLRDNSEISPSTKPALKRHEQATGKGGYDKHYTITDYEVGDTTGSVPAVQPHEIEADYEVPDSEEEEVDLGLSKSPTAGQQAGKLLPVDSKNGSFASKQQNMTVPVTNPNSEPPSAPEQPRLSREFTAKDEKYQNPPKSSSDVGSGLGQAEKDTPKVNYSETSMKREGSLKDPKPPKPEVKTKAAKKPREYDGVTKVVVNVLRYIGNALSNWWNSDKKSSEQQRQPLQHNSILKQPNFEPSDPSPSKESKAKSPAPLYATLTQKTLDPQPSKATLIAEKSSSKPEITRKNSEVEGLKKYPAGPVSFWARVFHKLAPQRSAKPPIDAKNDPPSSPGIVHNK